ncbi:S1 family peptidase [Natronosporangium hydrolyticum]|uniref:S1 family peptidase n=1 Tax=Natronosporangium hydrolyticum TaxID=2811111 RepID=A0A895YMS5_9ACTN|nr:S1 family peptidase [Natronosporangium hydrolyticum]QSB15218.1 S1 family peptidase [Natronosporangium hydrolyticum]
MTRNRATPKPMVVRGAVATLAVAALAVAGATPAAAHQPAERPTGDLAGGLHTDQYITGQFAGDQSAADGQVDQSVLTALERDLDLSADEVEQLLTDLEGVDELAAELAEELGQAYGGSWFDHETGSFTVAVTEAGPAAALASAEVTTERVGHSLQRLESITAELDELLEADPAALADVYSWRIEVADNQVVVTTAAGQADAVSGLVADYGDAVRVTESSYAPQVAQSALHGGTAYNGCSVGFNLVAGGTGYFLTAGHCGGTGQQTSQNGVNIGPFVESWFPGEDDALVRVDNAGAWTQGPTVWTYSGTVTINGWTDAAVGTPICTSGRTTGLTCGVITAKNETVNYAEGAVFGMTRHNACVEPGDSGGPNWNTVGGNYAEGVTSGAQMIGGQCLERFGMANVSWYYPISDSLPYYAGGWGVSLMTG